MTDDRQNSADANDRMDALIKEGAADYNRPGSTPRDEIWNRIQAHRHAARSSSRAKRGTWSLSRAQRGTLLMLAATLVIGIVLGRAIERSKPAKPESIVQIPAPSSNDSLAAAASYRRVMLEHIGNSEAMITSFRANARSGKTDKQMAGWSNDLLLRTRMLESSPASQDPVMKRLLEDLDLVLAQINQYSSRGTHRPDDLDLIEQSIDQRGVMTKLRATNPAPTTAPAQRGS
jgi:hypothetical protein